MNAAGRRRGDAPIRKDLTDRFPGRKPDWPLAILSVGAACRLARTSLRFALLQIFAQLRRQTLPALSRLARLRICHNASALGLTVATSAGAFQSQ
jgi:hypothetical protein